MGVPIGKRSNDFRRQSQRTGITEAVNTEVKLLFAGYPDILKVEEVGKVLRIGRNTAYELVRAGFIRSFAVGRSLRVTKQAVVDYINRQHAEKL